MYEYEKKMAAALMIADTLNPIAMLKLAEDIKARAEAKQAEHDLIESAWDELEAKYY